MLPLLPLPLRPCVHTAGELTGVCGGAWGAVGPVSWLQGNKRLGAVGWGALGMQDSAWVFLENKIKPSFLKVYEVTGTLR